MNQASLKRAFHVALVSPGNSSDLDIGSGVSDISEQDRDIPDPASDNLFHEQDHEDILVSARHKSPSATRKDFHCPFDGCGKAYTKPSKLEEHVRSHSGEKPYRCPVEGCQNAYIRNSHLKRHFASHTSERPFQCVVDDCGKSFGSKAHLNRHVLTHERDKPFICSVSTCSEAFAKKSQLRAHVHAAHSGYENEYICSYEGCRKSFKVPSQLKYHIRSVHENDAKFVCGHPDCAPALEADGTSTTEKLLVFDTKQELNEHTSACHAKNLKCSDCGLISASRKALQQHYRTMHVWTEEQRKSRCVCEQCGKLFSKASNLATHVQMVHEDLRLFSCEKCDSRFSTKGSLKRHDKLMHSGVVREPKKRKTLERTSAGLASQISGLDYDANLASEEFRCPIEGCLFAFSRQYDLIRHLKSAEFHGGAVEVEGFVDDMGDDVSVSGQLVPTNI